MRIACSVHTRSRSEKRMQAQHTHTTDSNGVRTAWYGETAALTNLMKSLACSAYHRCGLSHRDTSMKLRLGAQRGTYHGSGSTGKRTGNELFCGERCCSWTLWPAPLFREEKWVGAELESLNRRVWVFDECRGWTHGPWRMKRAEGRRGAGEARRVIVLCSRNHCDPVDRASEPHFIEL